MSARRATRMDAIEIEEFVDGQSTGVLSLASGDESYAIPVSFAYEGGDVYLRLGYGPDSHKREFVEASDYVSFVVYDRTDGGWKSVVARGELETISEGDLDASITEVIRSLDIPYFRVFVEESSDVEFSIVRIDVDDLTGIVSGGHEAS